MAVPSHQEAALISTTQPPPHTDPYAFGDILQKICDKHGVGYVDAINEFKSVPHCDRLFYLFESHVNVEGDAALTRALVRKCTDGSVPALTVR